jgi:hypothetical protein
MAVFHELTHIATSDYLDEIYPYLVEISATQCHWLRVYKIIRDAITNRESWSVEHSQAVHFFLTEFFPNIFQQREPGSLEGIPEDMHLAAAKVLNEGYPTGLFIAISLLSEEILKKEASHEFLELRQRDKTKAGSPVVQKEEVNASGAQTNKDLGGIDMRSLPKYTKVERVGGTTSLSAAPICNFSVGPSINQDKEWLDIERMANSGIEPSLERIREYLLSLEDPNSQMDKVLACFANILRIEEDRVAKTASGLKEILVLLESGKPSKEIQVALSQIAIEPKEPQLVTP